MDFSKLIQTDLTPLWLKNIIQSLSPYPYFADILMISFAFVGGAVLAQHGAGGGTGAECSALPRSCCHTLDDR